MRTLMGDTDPVMLDEPVEGLMSKLAEQVAEYLRELQRRGVCVLLRRAEANDRAGGMERRRDPAEIFRGADPAYVFGVA